jgi:hypothetical protein
VRPSFARLLSLLPPVGLNAGVRVTNGTILAFAIVGGAVVLALLALAIRPPPPSMRGPATGPATTHRP